MIPWLSEHNHDFPTVSSALSEPNGLLAAGGDLSPKRLIAAYKKGIFPWYSDPDPILWWSPAPRCVLPIDQLHISKSLKKTLKKKHFSVSFDKAFSQVIQQCSLSRKDQEGTWITDDIQAAYLQLHHMGVAHSVEVWDQNELVGGLYGIALGNVFFGESMFSKQNNCSKIAFCFLVNQLRSWHFKVIDCQVHSPHLQSLGAIEIERKDFLSYLADQDKSSTLAPNGYWDLSILAEDIC
ncbi:MAG: leucyl/phenylalanyl-tRNA--protein transferase [Oceanospirillaceae bacterium]